MSEIQLTGLLKIDSVDVSAFVSSMVIKRTRSAVTVPASLGNIREVDKAGSLKEVLEVNFFSSMAATSLWAELYDAVDTDAAELSFEGRLDSAAVSANNPKFTGTIVVLGVDTGSAVGSLREQTQTFPITSAGITKSAS